MVVNRTRSPTSRTTRSWASPWRSPTRFRCATATPIRSRTTTSRSCSTTRPRDLCVLHTGAHNWEDQGGHRGEHGSLGIVQARAPFVVAGKGVRNDGIVPRSGRLVDLAPTVAELLRCATDDHGHHLAGQDGVVRTDVLDPATGPPRHVVGFLFDGVNPNVLYAMAAAGEAPNVARLIEMGTASRRARWAGFSPRSRWPTTRRFSPGGSRVTTASCTMRGSTGRPESRSSPTPRPPGRGRCSTSRRGWSPSTRRSTGRIPMRSPRRSTNRAIWAPTTPPSTTSAAARSRRSPRHPRGCRTRPSASCARRRTTRGRRWSTTWARSRPSASGAGTTATCRSRSPGSCGATSPSPTPRSTRVGRSPRSPRRRCAIPTRVSATCSPRSSVRVRSTTPCSSSSPITACRRRIRTCAAIGTSQLREGRASTFRDEGYCVSVTSTSAV